MVYDTCNCIMVHGVCKTTFKCGAPHCSHSEVANGRPHSNVFFFSIFLKWPSRESWRILDQKKLFSDKPKPTGSMYGIYANIGGMLMVNVIIYGIHGSYGYELGIILTAQMRLMVCNNPFFYLQLGMACFQVYPSMAHLETFVSSKILCNKNTKKGLLSSFDALFTRIHADLDSLNHANHSELNDSQQEIESIRMASVFV